MSKAALQTLIIDNYDSFTFNLYQMIAAVNGEEPLVVRNDQYTWEELEALSFDNIVISPGPGTPTKEEDLGVCREVILQARVPVLGVCLGHQALGLFYGGAILHAPDPMHGRISKVYHDGSPLYANIPQGFEVVRYHSLQVSSALPDCLQRNSWTFDQLIMGLSHRTLPRWGVQFHPESICTEYGAQLLQNFRDLSYQSQKSPRASSAARTPKAHATEEPRLPLEVRAKRLSFLPDAARAFSALYKDEANAFWLDSSLVTKGSARFSFMGAGGPESALVSYQQSNQELTVTARAQTYQRNEDLYTFLARELARRKFISEELPFDFNCGFVGYFGYELKAALGAQVKHQSEHPDALFLFADRLLAFDHQESVTYLVCLVQQGDLAAALWLEETEKRLRSLPLLNLRPPTVETIELCLGRSRRVYLSDIGCCQGYLRDGESYELCLTNQLHASPVDDPLALYLTLRRINPAPYAAFLRFGSLCILSSSPERFLHIDQHRVVESKPIKGTRPRGKTPEEDESLRKDLSENEKDRSENLMIVDLIRNDLGAVCKIGTVHVPKLMQVESYQTVHQLVSTIRGELRTELSALDCFRAAFPGGSMTGAPKLRTMKLIDKLETEARGIYSGSIGFLALNGTADLNIVIRTLVSTPSETTLGVGGAIVALSEAEEEFEETLVKARALIEALLLHAKGDLGPGLLETVFAALREQGFASV
jgi:para-aminobenzoate synthetase